MWRTIAAAAACSLAVAVPLLLWTAGARRPPEQPAGVAHAPDPAAVELYLQGRYYWEKRDGADLKRAVDLFTQAIVRDPAYAEAYAGLADCYNLLHQYAMMAPEEAYPRAIAAATRAIQLDDNLAQAHVSLAFATFYWKWDAAGADREFQRAIQLQPDLAVAHHWYANTLSLRHRAPEATREIEIAQRLDPSSTAILASKGMVLMNAGDDAQAVALLEQLETANPGYLAPHEYLAGYYLAHGDGAKYVAEMKASAALSGNPLEAELAAAAGKGLAAGGYSGMLRSMMAILGNSTLNERDNWLAAQVSAYLGRPEESLRFLRLAYRLRDPRFYDLGQNPAFRLLRGNAEFEQMTRFEYRSASEGVAEGTGPQTLAAEQAPGAPGS